MIKLYEISSMNSLERALGDTKGKVSIEVAGDTLSVKDNTALLKLLNAMRIGSEGLRLTFETRTDQERFLRSYLGA